MSYAAGRAPYLKVGCYTVVMLMILGGLIVVFGDFRSGTTESYSAVFADASGLKKGQKVRVAGVEVGKVSDVELQSDASVLVDFTVASTRPLDTATRAQVRYENLTGDRYLDISKGADTQQVSALAPGGVIPEASTSPALDIDSLVGGFKPLFRSVTGDELNKLTAALIGTLQGQGGEVRTLLDTVGSSTSMLAEQDSVIGELIDNLNTVLTVADKRRNELSQSVGDLQAIVSQFANQADPMDQIIDHLEGATLAGGGLLANIRPDIRESVIHLDTTTANLVNGQEMLDSTLSKLPEAYRRLGRMGGSGAAFQMYACQGILRLTGTDGKNVDIPLLDQTTGRCAK
ncbi:MCE family protein [Gordonia aichiensis]|uniref:Mce family protein n=1 Tax=Gordonia aichiensis NBRC 108223 TaxID=1220583 RepID=L7KIV3_9ACTN|nr:MCE family protein [Gordonia aichiensis]GAC47897.1 Mce family protein [Gordonia aichiensis NBRC 108223]